MHFKKQLARAPLPLVFMYAFDMISTRVANRRGVRCVGAQVANGAYKKMDTRRVSILLQLDTDRISNRRSG